MSYYVGRVDGKPLYGRVRERKFTRLRDAERYRKRWDFTDEATYYLDADLPPQRTRVSGYLWDPGQPY